MPAVVKSDGEAIHDKFYTAAAFDVGSELIMDSASFHEALPEITAYCEMIYTRLSKDPLLLVLDGTFFMPEPVDMENSPAIVDRTPFFDSIEDAFATPAEWADGVLSSVLDDVSENLLLPDDWDGYGGLPTTIKAAEQAELILTRTTRLAVRLSVEPSVAPLADGGLDIEWIARSGNELLLEVPPGADYLNYVLSQKQTDGSFVYQNGRINGPKDVTELIRAMA